MSEQLEINEALLVLVKAGDLAAFNSIITAWQKLIFNHIYRLTGSESDAADLTQETFLKVYKKRNLIDPTRNFKTWLYKVATNTTYDWFDKNKRRRDIPLPTDDESETIGPQLPYYRVDKATSIDLELALAKIKPQYRSVIFLYYQQGFTYEEIAEIMKIPLGTVKTLLYRAKQALAKELS